MGRGFARSVIVGCGGSLVVAGIDCATGFIASGSRFASPAFAATAFLGVFLVTLACYLAVHWLVARAIGRRADDDGNALSIAVAIGVGVVIVIFEIGSPHAGLSRLLEMTVDVAVGAVAGTGTYALACADSQRAGMTVPRRAGRALPLLAPIAVVAAWFTFVRIDDVRSTASAALLVAFLVVALLVGRVASRLPIGRWRAAVAALSACALVVGVACALVTASHPAMVPGKGTKVRGTVPRVILLTVDTLRRDALSCYGPSATATPAIDRIAAEGVLFRNVTASSSWTLPSFASMMTGLTTRGHGVDVSNAALPDTVATLAERFRAAGYATHALVANAMLAPHRGFAQGFQRYHLPAGRLRPTCLGEAVATRLRREPISEEASTRDVTDAAIAWIRARRNDSFFLWVHYLDPHLPYTPPESAVERMNIHDEMGFELDITSATRPTMDLFGDPSRRTWARSLYDGEVRHVDAEIGRFLDALRDAGLYDDALLVFAADHGEEFWDHDGFEHGHTLYEELVGVPLIIKTPGRAVARVVDDAVAIYDVAPTVLALCGLPAVTAPKAISLAGYLGGATPPAGPRPVFASGTLFRSNFECVVFEGWKYVRSATTGREELFRLADDPLERRSLALDFPDVAARGRYLIDEHARATESFRMLHDISNPQIELDADEIERLRSLGYL
ncbi:MAG TPA: sulfatase [Candidatus Krumholzibacteria bacterium]|nr:sulfatase [Candidatus Krumholzibacteria bacterium]